MGPKLKIVDYNPDKPNPQAWGFVKGSDTIYEGRFCWTVRVVSEKGWNYTSGSKWEWYVETSDGEIEEKKWIGNFKLGPKKFETKCGFIPEIKCNTAHPNWEGQNVKVGGQFRDLDNCYLRFVAGREFTDGDDIRYFTVETDWGKYEVEPDPDPDPQPDPDPDPQPDPEPEKKKTIGEKIDAVIAWLKEKWWLAWLGTVGLAVWHVLRT